MLDKLFRKLPPFKGKQRLARLLLSRAIEEKKDIWITGDGGNYLVPNIKESVGFEIYINGIYEGETSRFIAKKIPPAGIFLDVGANIGAVTIPLYTLRKDITAVCIEAAPWIFEYLKKNLAKNKLENVITINKGLYDKDNHEMDFFSPTDNFGKGSLAPVFTDKAVKVTTVTLDTLVEELKLPKVDFIKMDVEGFEYYIFKGGEKLLNKADAPDILFEFVDWAEQHAGLTPGTAQELIASYGYDLFSLQHGRLKKLDKVLRNNSGMVYATKRKGSI